MSKSSCCPLTQNLFARLSVRSEVQAVHSAPAVFKISQQLGFCLCSPVSPHEPGSPVCINKQSFLALLWKVHHFAKV